MVDGGDSKGVCFNTVAILFLAEVDNVLYEYGLSVASKRYVESRAKIALDEQQATALSQTKTLHAMLIIPVMFVGPNAAIYGGPLLNFVIAPLPFVIAGLVERLREDGVEAVLHVLTAAGFGWFFYCNLAVGLFLWHNDA